MTERTDLTLDPQNWDALRQLGHQMVDDMFAHVQQQRERPAWQPVPDSTKAKFQEGLPYRPLDAAAVYADFKEYILPYPTGNTHPRFWAWVMGSGTPLGALSDMLASAMNPNVCLGDQAAVRVEEQVLNWCKELLDFPETASGILTSGASMANLTALLVARNHQASGDMRQLGLQHESGQLVLYCSTETHNCIRKAAEVMGLGAASVCKVPVDEHFQIRTDLLELFIQNDIAGGRRPFCIVGNAGTVNTGAIDPLDTLLELSRKYGLWFHVDGAFGALAKRVPEYAEALKALEAADSVAFDLHKWLFMPYEVGCVLVRNAAAHKATFDQEPNYLLRHERGLSAGDLSLGDYGIELSRGFKALKVWMCLKTHGAFAYLALIRQNIAQARYLASEVDRHPELDLLAPANLNIVCFRYKRPDCDPAELQAVNREILMRLQEEGIAVLSATVLQGEYALRVAICNHRTRQEDLNLLLDAVVRIGNAVVDESLFLI
ncbi:MAG: aminotransferase class V-fold PLP-dependent enzyme [Bacteroidetes bacterium]|nr:MAG: aminotransferase class V-fold PLP-dependent enzyme [Bacteroidota bacterium]